MSDTNTDPTTPKETLVIGDPGSGKNALVESVTNNTPPPADFNWQAFTDSQVAAAKKKATKDAQNNLLQGLGFENTDQLKEVVTSHRQMLDAQKTDQQKADEDRLAMEKKFSEQAAQLASANAALIKSEVKNKLASYAREFCLKASVASLLVTSEASKYTPAEGGIDDNALRDVIKKFAEDHPDQVETTIAKNSSAAPSVSSTGVASIQKSNDFIEMSLRKSRHFNENLSLN